MRVSDCMTRDPRVADPNQTLREAARTMSELDTGVLPVGENDRLVGIITDRDIAIRGIAQGKGPDATIRETMSTGDVCYCFEDQDVEEVLRNMAEVQVRRMPVLSRDKRLVGMVSIGDLAKHGPDEPAGHALEGIARSSDQHRQQAH